MSSHFIGPLGTIARVAAGGALLFLAIWGQKWWGDEGLQWHEVVLGIAVFPGVVLLAQWLFTRVTREPLQATGAIGFHINCCIVVALFAIPFTRDAAALFYGASMLLAAVRGYAGCEVLAITNWLLRRNDQVGCLLFSPIDAAEAKLARRTVAEPSNEG